LKELCANTDWHPEGASRAAAWRSFADAQTCLEALQRAAQLAVLSNVDQQREEKVSSTGLIITSTSR